MLKTYLRVIILLLLPAGAAAQSLSVSVQGNTSGSSASALSLAGGEVSFSESEVRFTRSGTTVSRFIDYGVSPDLSVVGFLTGSGGSSRALVLDSAGDTLSSFGVTALSPGDPSVATFPSNTGALLVRDNIASFSFYDSFGEIITQASSSSQSEGGEAISEVAMDPSAETVVIYNPKIRRGGKLGSQAQVLNASDKLESIYFDTERIIKDVNVSDDGQFIVLVTSGSRGDDRAIVMDRFGNELNTIATDEELTGARLSEGARYITLFSQGRVLVFNTLNGDREGSASLRSPIVIARYFPQDQTVLAMTGNHSAASGTVRNVSFHAIHLGQRKIARQSFGSAIGLNKAVRHELVRTSRGRYQLQGASKLLQIQASF